MDLGMVGILLPLVGHTMKMPMIAMKMHMINNILILIVYLFWRLFNDTIAKIHS